MRKFIVSLIMIVSIVTTSNVYAVSANAAVVIDGDTGEVLFSKNADAVLPMASTTKTMTAIVAIEQGNIDRKYKVKKEYTLVEGSSMYLKEGEEISIKDTLYGLMLMSGNDAALAISGECGPDFVGKMNKKAEELGLSNTHFDNPNGLDGETHHTTALELAKIAAYGLKNPTFAEIVSTKYYKGETRSMKNHNKLLWLYEDCVGVKTGFTKKSGRCLVSAVKKDGRTLVAVTLHASDDWNDHMAMYNSCLTGYEQKELHKADDIITEQFVYGGTKDKIKIKAKNGISISTNAKDQIKTEIFADRVLYAPINKGDTYGKIRYSISDTLYWEDDLIFDEDIVMDEPVKTRFEIIVEKLRKFV